MLQIARGKGRDVLSIPFPLKRRFADHFISYFLRFRIEFALLLLALYERYISQSGVSIFDPNGREAELVFVRRRL